MFLHNVYVSNRYLANTIITRKRRDYDATWRIHSTLRSKGTLNISSVAINSLVVAEQSDIVLKIQKKISWLNNNNWDKTITINGQKYAML